MKNYLDKVRPEESIRDQLDLGSKIERQSIELFEIRPVWNYPSQTMHVLYAKTTYIKTKNKWKMFWMRADLKWHCYTPNFYVNNLKEALEIIDIDKHGCVKVIYRPLCFEVLCDSVRG